MDALLRGMTFTNHDSVPSIASWIATHEREAETLLYNYILAVAQLVTVLDLVFLESVKVLECGRPVRQHGPKRYIAVVEPWSYQGYEKPLDLYLVN